MPKILGIDSSLTGTGLAKAVMPDIMVGVDPRGPVPATVQMATVSPSKSKPGDTWLAKDRRIHEVLDTIDSAILETKPDAIGLEELAYGAQGTAVVVLHWLWGEIIHLARINSVPIYLVNVATVKKFATGNGNAKKDAVMLAMSNRYPQYGIADNNQSDALAVCMIVARELGVAFDTMPQLNLDALKPVKGKAKVALQ